MNSNRKSGRSVDSFHAFSLMELLLVLTMLGVASFLMTPALARTKANGRAIGCLNNLRRVMEAWTMYAEEHRGKVVNNFGVASTQNTISDGTYQNWANDVIDWTSTTMNTNITLVTRVGQLGPYLSGNSNVFKCPADNYVSPLQRSLGWTSRARSISMNSVFGRFSTGTDSTAQGLNWFSPAYLQYLGVNTIPKPSRTWLFLDEHPDSINDGYFIVDPYLAQWTDTPASHHNGGCGIAFADGHSEIHKWLSATSQTPVRYSYFLVSPDAAGRQDIQWLLQRTGYVVAVTGRPAFGY